MDYDVVILLFLLLVAAYLAYVVLTAKTFNIKEEAREAIVVQHRRKSERKKVLRAGIKTLPFWWVELAKIHLDLELIESGTKGDPKAGTKDNPNEEVVTSDNVTVLIQWKGHMVTGQPSNENGQPDTSSFEPTEAEDEQIIATVTRIMYDKREAQVRAVIAESLQNEVRRYLAKPFLTPEKCGGLTFLALRQNRATGTMCRYQEVVLAGDLLDRLLAETIQNSVNYKLQNKMGLGLHLVNFGIINLKAAEDKMRDAIESGPRTERYMDAAQEAHAKGGLGIPTAAALAKDQSIAATLAAQSIDKAVEGAAGAFVKGLLKKLLKP